MTQLIAYVQALLVAREDRERGATMVEYGLMLALIAVVCILAVTAIGARANGVFEDIRDALPAV